MPKRLRKSIVTPNLRTSQFIVNSDGDDAVLFVGRHNGHTVSALTKTTAGRSYLKWVLTSDLQEELKSVCRYQLKRQEGLRRRSIARLEKKRRDRAKVKRKKAKKRGD